MSDEPSVGEPPFAKNAVSPIGVRYRVQAVPVYGSSGPPMLGTDGPATHGVLGFVNRHLLRHLGWHENNGFAAFVYRDEPGDPIVAESEHSTMSEARDAALTFVRHIEDGTLPGM